MTHDWLNLSWKMLMVRGALAIVFGLVAMAWPLETAIALAIVFGFWALVDGVGSFAWAPDGKAIAFTMTDPKSDAHKDRDKKFGEFDVVDQDWRMKTVTAT